jgi:hypothetical protein
MDPTDPIRRVPAVSTGRVPIRLDHQGVGRQVDALVAARLPALDRARPINAYVIEHREGLVLFDAEQDRASVTAPRLFPRRHDRGAVRPTGRPALMMVGDVTNDADLLELGHVPGVGSRRRLRDATAMINTMRQRDPGLVILPAYDPAAASRLAQATDRVPALATV